MQDPKEILINLLTANLSVTKDDNATKANVVITSQWYSDQVMASFDALVTVGTLTDPINPAGFGFVGGEDHTYMADVNVWTTNKYGASGARVITDEVIRYKIVQAISQIITENYTSIPGIHRARIRAYRDLDDPSAVPYPLRRSNFEVELFFSRTSLAA